MSRAEISSNLRAPSWTRVTLTALALVAGTRAGRAQCLDWTPGFHTNGMNNVVSSLHAADLGAGARLFAGGIFDTAGEVAANSIASFDGVHWSRLGVANANGTNARVAALADFDDGGGRALYAAGAFTQAGGVFSPGVARWNGTSWSSITNAADNEVLALAVFDDGSGPQLYAGGQFTNIGGVPAAHLARWNGSSWQAVGAGTNQVVFSLHVHDDGSGPALYVGGAFTSAGGAPIPYLARWNGSSWSAPAPGLNGYVYAMATFTQGAVSQLAIGGSFGFVAGSPAASVARFDGTNWSDLGGGCNNIVRALCVHDDGSGVALYAGGDFTLASGATARRIARWSGSTWTEVGGGTPSSVNALASFDAGAGARLFAAGAFGEVGGVNVGRIAAWDGNTWSTAGSPGQGLANGSSIGVVNALAVLPETSGPVLCATGTFTFAGGAPIAHAARWNGSAWSAMGASAANFGASYALALLDLGAGPELYMGGTLSLQSNVQRWNGVDWEPVNAPGLEMFGVRELAAFDDGSGPALYAAGFAPNAGYHGMVLARWTGTTWAPLPGGLSYPADVDALTVFDDGSGPALYVGGFFFSIGAPSIPAFYVAKWNGSAWTSLGTAASSVGHRVNALIAHDDGMGGGTQLYAGGEFAGGVKRWNGSSWSLVGAGLGSYAPVRAFAVFDDGSGPALYATGQLNPVNGTPRWIARWDGVAWSELGAGLNAWGLSLAVYDDARGEGPALFVGGTQTRAGDVAASGLARWRGCRVTSFCTGDGLDPSVTTGCPCGNTGAAGRGCAWSAGGASGALEVSGRIDPDTLVLLGSQMPTTSTAIYLKGDAVASGGIVFGDGVRCVDGNLIRMGIVQNNSGASQFPNVGQAPISVRGNTPPGSGLIGYYQTYFRSANPTFCPPATFNVTNGVRIAW